MRQEIYVLMENCGEWSDSRSRPVCYFTDKHCALEAARRMNDMVNDLEEDVSIMYEKREDVISAFARDNPEPACPNRWYGSLNVQAHEEYERYVEERRKWDNALNEVLEENGLFDDLTERLEPPLDFAEDIDWRPSDESSSYHIETVRSNT